MFKIKKIRLSLIAILLCFPFFSGCEDCNAGPGPAYMDPPFLAVSTTALNFGSVGVGTQKFLKLTLINQGDRTLQVSDVKIANSPLFIFGIDGDTIFTIHPRQEHVLNVWFWPSESLAYAGSLKIYSDTVEPSNGPVLVDLVGEANDICGDCNSPPDPICLPSGDLLYYEAQGRCENNSCRYIALIERCEGYCELNLLVPACVDDSDAGILPPDPSLVDSGSVIVEPFDAGELPVEVDSGQDEEVICPDTDSDDVCDSADNCVTIANADQTDTDADGVGNLCDNCPGTINADQEDTDGDGVGDVCDLCQNFDDATDADEDGRPDRADCDNCIGVSNLEQTDTDEDGIGDACDLCPTVPQGDGIDTDEDGIDDQCASGTCIDDMSNWIPPTLPIQSTRFERVEAVADTNSGDINDDSEWVVNDTLTGLSWRGCVYGLSGSACDDGSAQIVSYGTHLNFSANIAYGGHSDWRMPTLNELRSLADFGPTANLDTSTIFPQLKQDVWTQTPKISDSNTNYGLHFSNNTNQATMTSLGNTGTTARGLYVRGGHTSERCLEVNVTDDGTEETVTDALVGLMWQRGIWVHGYSTAVGDTTWMFEDGSTSNSPTEYGYYYPSTNNPCSETFAGENDWRLPTVYELESIVSFLVGDESFLPTFPQPTFYNFYAGGSSPYFWSSSIYGLDNSDDANDYWVVRFDEGTTTYLDGDSVYAYIRCVRDL